MASLFKVKALYDFEAKEGDDLGFPGGQIIDVTEEVDDNWLEGRYTDATGAEQAGIFPREFVEKYEPDVPARPARPSRPKSEAPLAALVSPPVPEPAEEPAAEAAPPVPVTSKPPAPPAEVRSPDVRDEAVPASASQPSLFRTPAAQVEPPQAPKPAPAEVASPASKKAPPPIASKSNAFRDRIAAFNQNAAPIVPIQPGAPKTQASSFIKKPFVAPPPSSHSYVPAPKVEPVYKPYMREEDPEIQQQQADDHAAAESAGLVGGDTAGQQNQEGEEAAPTTSLKERIARLQQQQLEQAQRKADTSVRKEKKLTAKATIDQPNTAQTLDEEQESTAEPPAANSFVQRQSLDVPRERPRIPSAPRRPAEPTSAASAISEPDVLSDGNDADQSAADETTEDDETGTIGPDENDRDLPRAVGAPQHEANVGDEDDTVEDEEEEEYDEETRRRMELRERMAKMSGGMGMAGMFGAPAGFGMPGAVPPKKKSTREKKADDEEPLSTEARPQARVPLVPVMGLPNVRSPESDATEFVAESEVDRELGGDNVRAGDISPPPVPSRQPTAIGERGAPPPIPQDARPVRPQERGPPPPVPGRELPPRPSMESRPSTGPPLEPLVSPGPGSESDDEASLYRRQSTLESSEVETPGALPIRSAVPPIPSSRDAQGRTPIADPKRASYFSADAAPPTSVAEKRASRLPPPIPGTVGVSRPPPPPPPPPATEAQALEDDDRGESDYEGDYDTDIASSADHKNALTAHVREPSLDESTDTPVNSPPPPPPHANLPRAVPPPPPSQLPPRTRMSTDLPRAPPPMPPQRDVPATGGDEDYDPFRYEGIRPVPPLPPTARDAAPAAAALADQFNDSSADDQYLASSAARPSIDRPPPPVPQAAPPEILQSEPAPGRTVRASLDVARSGTVRRSMEAGQDQIANDVDLSPDTEWWTATQPLPPVLQKQNGIDILTECEESTTTARGGKSTTSKEIYILFRDYSQTIVSVKYNTKEPKSAQLEQVHKPPPPKLRQDQLETYWERFGSKIVDAARSHGQSKKDSVVGNGSAPSLIAELIKAQPDALAPVGQRAYGALVYANLANASTQQFDEIRPGDVITVRNAKFEGHHGAMKTKYKQEYGASHVAIVDEWDGTKRALRAWEQGREKKGGVRSEKFRLADLRSGEVRVWRVVGRDYVEW